MNGRAWWNNKVGANRQTRAPLPADPVPEMDKAELLRLAHEVEDAWIREKRKKPPRRPKA